MMTIPEKIAPPDAILHLFNWRFSDILSILPQIAADGFGAIQISPPQLSVETDEWWGRYQPVDHTRIGGPLGSEADLRALIQAAHACDPPLRVIVDVVFNHMAESCPHRATLQYPRFGPEHFHPQAEIDWNSIESIRTGWIGYGPDLPDLRTEDAYVRAEARQYLAWLLELGADGFRFDAVKHIEPEFFDIVLAGLSSELVVYGEYILQPGHQTLLPAYLRNMKLMDFALLETMTAAFAPSGDLRTLVDPTSRGGALPDHKGIAFVTNHDLELGEYGGFGLPKDVLDLGQVYTIIRPESLPLIWESHRHEPLVVASMRLRQLARDCGWEIAWANKRVLAWRIGDLGAVILNANGVSVHVSIANLGLRDSKAVNMLTGQITGHEAVIRPKQPLLLEKI